MEPSSDGVPSSKSTVQQFVSKGIEDGEEAEGKSSVELDDSDKELIAEAFLDDQEAPESTSVTKPKTAEGNFEHSF